MSHRSQHVQASPDRLPVRDRIAELLGWLQLGTCADCGRARYFNRREARYAARLASPRVRLRAYRCGRSWHLGSPAGRPPYIASPVTALPPHIRRTRGLDLQLRVERAYRGRHYPSDQRARLGDRRRDAIAFRDKW